MKNKIKLGFALTVGFLLVSNAYALTAGGPPPVVAQQPAPVLTPQVQPAAQPTLDYSKGGNAFEKEVTPLLREISRKKSILEIRKLDREIEKLDEDALKAQSGGNNNTDSGFVPVPTPVVAPVAPAPVAAPVVNNVPESNMHGDDVSVIMIYGYDTDLFAKISYGKQGGYPVKKGDILPDGRKVYDVTSNYIEVGSSTAKGKKKVSTTRIYATGYPKNDNNNANSRNTTSYNNTPVANYPLPTGLPSTPIVSGNGIISNSPTIGLPVMIPQQGMQTNQ